MIRPEQENETMTTKPQSRTAEQAYSEHQLMCLAMLDVIRTTVENRDNVELDDDGNGLHWGHVGDIAEVESLLHQVAGHLGLEQVD